MSTNSIKLDISNLDSFLKRAAEEKISEEVELDTKLSLSRLLQDFPYDNNTLNSNLFNVVLQNIEGREQHLFDLAKTAPKAFKYIYNVSGSSTNGSDRSVPFTIIQEKLDNNSFADNLYAINAVLDAKAWGLQYNFIGKKDDIRSLPKDRAKILANLFYESGTNDGANRLIEAIIKRGDLLSYTPKDIPGYNIATPKQIRDRIEENIGGRILQLDHKFMFNGNKYNKNLLKQYIEASMTRPNKDVGDKPVSSAQQLKRAQYLSAGKLLIDIAQSNINKYDSANGGAEKTVTRRFTELMEDLYGKPYNELPHNFDEYKMSAIRQDIKQGNTAKLDDDSLHLLVQHDDHADLLQKIAQQDLPTAQKIISQFRRDFSPRQNRIADLIAPEIALKQNPYYNFDVADNKYMSTKEKSDFLDAVKKIVEEQLIKPAADKKSEAEQYLEDTATLDKLSNKQSAEKQMAFLVKELQQTYNSLQIKGEEDLAKDNVEKILAQLPDRVSLPMPEYRSLPLFGRQKEKERREHNIDAVNKFNKSLTDFYNFTHARGSSQPSKYAEYIDFEPFSGKLLDTATANELSKTAEDSLQKLTEYSQNYQIKWENMDKYKAERAIKDYDTETSKLQRVEEAQRKVGAKITAKNNRKIFNNGEDEDKLAMRAKDKKELSSVQYINKYYKLPEK